MRLLFYMKKEISVLFVTTNLNYNGAKKYIVEVANELACRGYKVGLLFDGGPLAKNLNENVKKYHIKVRGLGFDPISRVRTIFKAAFIARNEGFNIIHGEASSSLLSHKLLSTFSKSRVVETIHHIWTKEAERQKAAKRLPGRADVLIAISQDFLTVLKKAGLISKKIVVIQNGIDTKKFGKTKQKEIKSLKADLGVGEKDPVLVWVSRVCGEKTPESFVNWFPYILADFPNARFVMVGDNGSGDRTYLNSLIEKIKSLGLNKHIICVGGQTDVEKYLALGDIFTITRLARDLSVMEAMASGLPVIVSRTGMLKPELVLHGKTGFLFDKFAWQQWADQVKYLLSNPHTAKKFGELGKKRVNTLFSIERYVNDLEKVYEHLI